MGQYGLQRREEKQREANIDSLRTALIAELRTVDEPLKSLLYMTHDMEKAKKEPYALTEEQSELFESALQHRIGSYRYAADMHWFSNEVYQSNADKIGELSPETAAVVIKAYNSIEDLYQGLQNLAEAIEYDELMFTSDIDWSKGEIPPPRTLIPKHQIEITVSRAVISQKVALKMLGDTWSKDDKRVLVFAFSHKDPRNEDEAQIQKHLKAALEQSNASSIEELIDNEEDHSMASESVREEK